MEKGVTIMKGELMEKTCTDYYSKSYASHLHNVGREDIVQDLCHVPRKISGEGYATLDKAITIEELPSSLEEMTNNKVPGPDGLTLEFFKMCWSFIREYNTCTLPWYKTLSPLASFHEGY